MSYLILQHDNAQEMQFEVQTYIDKGWILSGHLVSHNGFLHQAMYKD